LGLRSLDGGLLVADLVRISQRNFIDLSLGLRLAPSAGLRFCLDLKLCFDLSLRRRLDGCFGTLSDTRPRSDSVSCW
jgi:hypothetical protein